MSSALIKLIDTSLLPASTMIVAKLLSVILVAALAGITWNAEPLSFGSLLATAVVPQDKLTFVATFSDLVILLIMTVLTCWHIIELTRNDHLPIQAKQLAQLSNKGLFNLLNNPVTIHYRTINWLLFHFITTLTICFNALLGRSNGIVAIVAVAITLVQIFVTANSVDIKITLARKQLGKMQALGR